MTTRTPSGQPGSSAEGERLQKVLARAGFGSRRAAEELLAQARPEDGEVTVLVAPMIRGNRELIAGLLRDQQFGPTVMLGVGGILAEALADVVFRPAPLDEVTANEMIDGLATQVLATAPDSTGPDTMHTALLAFVESELTPASAV